MINKIRYKFILISLILFFIIGYIAVMEIKAEDNAEEFIPKDKIIEDAGVDFPIDI